ncbi:ABC transporter ATP-binding protein [Haloarcula litorea]|uniref:ABC transporter ATP-binding protein n=1 Tax=Haloarcula litorea TaxID=3032579 RepID=UPI0023E82CD4|nr:ABC transporter ATP-binding protein [Halomicroarcula sp. GDY20]
MAADEENPFDAHRADVDRPLVRLFREYGRPEWEWFVVGILANVVGRAATLVPPLVFGAAIDGVFSETTAFTLPLVPQSRIPEGQVAQLEFAVGLIVAAFLVGAVFTWLWGVTMNTFAHRVQHAVRTDTFAKMQTLDMAFFDDKQTGEVMSVLDNDASNLETFLDNALSDAVRIAVRVLGIAAILVYLNPQLAAVSLVGVPAIVLFTWGFARLVEPRYEAVRSSVGDLNTRLENSLGGIGLVKAAGTEAYETERVTDASREYYEANMAVLRLSYFYRPGMEALAGLTFAATFLVGGYWLVAGPPLFFSGELTLGSFTVFVLLIRWIVGPLAQIGNIVDWYENAKASGGRVFGLMDIPPDVADADDAVELTDVEGRVEYDDVTFAYDEETILEEVSFTAEPGETVALVGPTGAGKSTAVELLLRLYDVDGGAVRVDGHDVRDVTAASLRGSIGYVRQETFLFDGTIADNVRYGRFDADRDAVVEAAKAAEAHEFVTDLPDGYDTRVGERGVKLSGGQRQRIALARTVLQDPAMLVLDEATSAVDTQTEYRIQASLDRVAADRTTLVVAHRLSTIKDADTVLVLDGGEIAERGSHGDLLAADGLYATLWRAQAGEIESLPEGFLDRPDESDTE